MHDFQLLLTIEKRHINVPTFSVDARGANVVRFSFKNICGKTMGRAHYSTIAENCHSFYIEEVPMFESDLGANCVALFR